MERVSDPADPNRCQGPAPDGQCWNKAVEGQNHCAAHGGDPAKAAASEARQYRLAQAKYRRRQQELETHEALLSLRDEIVMLKILIEERYNMIKTDSDLLVACSPLNTLFLTLERLIKSCNQLEQNLGTLLGKAALYKFGMEIVMLLTEELQDLPDFEERIDRINERLLPAIGSLKNEDTK